jgi:hypothetical protein
MTSQVTQTFRAAFDLALNQLVITLREAQDFLAAGEDGAAIGTMLMFDDEAEDLKAALRLFRRARQSERRKK